MVLLAYFKMGNISNIEAGQINGATVFSLYQP